MCTRCQSVAWPLSELYWHIGETKMRFGNVTPRIVSGSNNGGRVLFREKVSCQRGWSFLRVEQGPQDGCQRPLSFTSNTGMHVLEIV